MSKDNTNNTSQEKNSKSGALTLIIIILSAAFLLTSAFICIAIGYVYLGLPDVSSIRNYRPAMVTTVLDADMNPIAYWYEQKRWPVTREQVPDLVVKAFLAAEDSRFYEHPGIDFKGVLRAAFKNIEAGGLVQGASTITQQVTRALLLTPEKSFVRKFKEAMLAWQIDSSLTKDEIITIYLNEIFFGNNAYGIESAARTYFGKHVWELSLSEAAILAGLPQAPSKYNPYKNIEAAKKRQSYVLKRMAEEGFVSHDLSQLAYDAPVFLAKESLDVAPGTEFFLADIRRDLEKRYGVNRLLTDGLTIQTTLKSDWQTKANDAVREGMEKLIKRHPKDKELDKALQSALVAIDLTNGDVKAMVGGRDFAHDQFNIVTQGRVQPGSSFKPIIYSAAIAEGLISPNTLIVDEPISFPPGKSGQSWQPKNYDGEYLGPITIKTALTMSRNVISVKIAKMLGIKKIHKTAMEMGIKSQLADDLTIALGSSAIPLIELVQAYSSFPNHGIRVTPRFIKGVWDRDGSLLEVSEPVLLKGLEPVAAYQMLDMLRGVVQSGTGTYARSLGVPAGGKTGTTDDCRDALFVGFTPEVVTGVWFGREDKKSLGAKETGGLVACPVWTEFMRCTLADMQKTSFDEMPDEAVLVPVDKATGEKLNEEQLQQAMAEDAKSVEWVVLDNKKLMEESVESDKQEDFLPDDAGNQKKEKDFEFKLPTW